MEGGGEDGSAGKDAWLWAWQPALDAGSPHGGRRETGLWPPLLPWQVYTHTNKQINVKNELVEREPHVHEWKF